MSTKCLAKVTVLSNFSVHLRKSSCLFVEEYHLYCCSAFYRASTMVNEVVDH